MTGQKQYKGYIASKDKGHIIQAKGTLDHVVSELERQARGRRR